MLSMMDDVQYNEHKLAEKAQRILDIKRDLLELKEKKEQLHNRKPSCNKSHLTYKESIELGQKVDRYEQKLRQVEVKILKFKRQLSALELQAQKLMPVSGVNVKVSMYSSEGQPAQTYCVQQKQNIKQSDSECAIQIEKL